mmetsp:Transcript_35852/g.78533  ORF Transcript_35852/g.78533 Transcript_35852/m.78533 type:complete len:82 (+) Transcript_35852:74-319(+)
MEKMGDYHRRLLSITIIDLDAHSRNTTSGVKFIISSVFLPSLDMVWKVTVKARGRVRGSRCVSEQIWQTLAESADLPGQAS